MGLPVQDRLAGSGTVGFDKEQHHLVVKVGLA